MGVYSTRYDGSYTVGEGEANDVAGSRGIQGVDLSSQPEGGDTSDGREVLLWKGQKYQAWGLT